MNEHTARANVANSFRDLRRACRTFASIPDSESENALPDLLHALGMVQDNRNQLRAILQTKEQKT